MCHQMFHIPVLMAGNLPKKVLKEDTLTTLGSFNYIITSEIFVLPRKLVCKVQFHSQTIFYIDSFTKSIKGYSIYYISDAQMIIVLCVICVRERRLFAF